MFRLPAPALPRCLGVRSVRFKSGQVLSGAINKTRFYLNHNSPDGVNIRTRRGVSILIGPASAGP